MARHFVDTMRAMFGWAVDAEIAKIDPTLSVRVVKPRTEGHPVWSDDEIERFRRRSAVGTRERVAFDLLYFTGLRRGRRRPRSVDQHTRATRSLFAPRKLVRRCPFLASAAGTRSDFLRRVRLPVTWPSSRWRTGKPHDEANPCFNWFREISSHEGRLVRVRRMDCERRWRRGSQTRVRRPTSWRRCSAGAAAAWPPSIRARRTERSSRGRRWNSF